MRIACLLIPDLPLQAALRAHPERVGRPLGLASAPGPRAALLCASPEAMRQGVRPGLTLPQARAVCPALEVQVASPVLEQSAREALLDAAFSLAPRAEIAPRREGLFMAEGAVHVDATGIEALHGRRARHPDPVGAPPRTPGEVTHDAEAIFASVLHARAERAGLRGFVAIASTRGTAQLAARHLALAARLAEASPSHEATDEPTATLVLPADEVLRFLAPLPIDLLDPDDRTAEALTRFGVHRVRELLRLPRRDLAARVGPGLLALVARARGEESEPPLPEPRTTTLEEAEDLEFPVVRLEPLRFVLGGLVERLVERLTLRGLGCAALRLSMQLEHGARLARRIGVASPSQDPDVLDRLLRAALERNPPPAPVEGIVLQSEGVPLRREQLDLFLPRGPSPSALDETLAELGALCGEERVGAPAVVDDHRPDAFAMKPFRRSAPGRTSPRHAGASGRGRQAARGGAPPAGTRRGKRRGRAPAEAAPARSRAPRPRAPRGLRLTLRALRPPLRAEVRLARGRPAHLHSAISRGEVVVAAGPWRTTGHWWSEASHFAMDHYDVQMRDGSVLRLCFDWKAKRWQIDGFYD